jgi:transposase
VGNHCAAYTEQQPRDRPRRRSSGDQRDPLAVSNRIVVPGATVLADKAYDTDGIRTFLTDRGAWPNIPPRSTPKGTFRFSRWVYRQRDLIERFFNRLKQMRGITTRYDRRADNFLAAIKLAAVRIWINAK